MTDHPREPHTPPVDVTRHSDVDNDPANPPAPSVSLHPREALAALLQHDPEYLWGWQCNVAMAIFDALHLTSSLSQLEANRAAERVISNVFGVDQSNSEQLKKLYGQLLENEAPPELAVWYCKIGEFQRSSLPTGADSPMRRAIENAYYDVTGQSPDFIFSGWGARLTPLEREAQDNMLRNEAMIPPPAEHDDSTVGHHPLTRDSYRAD